METTTTDSDRPMALPDTHGSIRSSRLRVLLGLLRHASEAITAAMMLAMLVIFVLQVSFRYLLNSPLSWTDEATVLLFPWLVFWGCSFLVPMNENVRFDIIYDAVSPTMRRVFMVISSVLILVVMIGALPKTWDYIDYMWRSRTPMLRIRYFWVFICYAMFMGVMGLRAALAIWLVASKDERAELV